MLNSYLKLTLYNNIYSIIYNSFSSGIIAVPFKFYIHMYINLQQQKEWKLWNYEHLLKSIRQQSMWVKWICDVNDCCLKCIPLCAALLMLNSKWYG